jgi:two-component system chemotaxis response regulator CheV
LRKAILSIDRESLPATFGEDVVGNIDKIERAHELCIFFADDSAVARRKISEVLEKMGVKHMQMSPSLMRGC